MGNEGEQRASDRPGLGRLAHLARQGLSRGVVDLATSAGLVLGLGFLQNLVLARVLGPEGLGHLSVVNTVVNFGNLTATAGVTTSILRYSAAERDPARAWAIFRRGVWVASGVSIAVAVLLSLLSRSPLWVFDPVAGLWLPLAAATLPAHALAACAYQYFQSRERMRAKAVLEIVAKFILVCGVVGGAVLAGFAGAIQGFVVCVFVGSAIAFGWVQKIRAKIRVPSPIPGRELLRFGLWGLFTNFLGMILVTADVLCLSALVEDASVVGFYSIAVIFQQIVRVPLRAYLDARFPEMTRRAAGPADLQQLRRTMRIHLIGIALASCAVVGLAAPWVIPFAFGEPYRASVEPLLVLLASHVFWSLGACQGRSMLAAGWVEGNFWASLFAAGANIALNLLLIPEWGAIGAAAATAITQLLWAGLVSTLCRFDEARRLRAPPGPR